MKNLLLAIWLFPGFILSGQTTIKWGPENQEEGNMHTYINVCGFTEKSYYAVQKDFKTASLLTYNQNHSKASQQAITYSYGKSVASPFDVLNTRSGVYLLFKGFDRSAKKAMMGYSRVDQPGNINNITTLVEFNRQYSLPEGYMFMYNSAADILDTDGARISPDSSKVLLVYFPDVEDENDHIIFRVTDDKLEKIYEVDKALLYLQDKFDVINYNISNNGDVYILGRDSGPRKYPNPGDYSLHVLKFTAGGGFTDKRLTLGDLSPTNAAVRDLENGTVLVTGGYTRIDDDFPTGTLGVYSMVLDASTLGTKSQSLSPFDQNKILELYGSNPKKFIKETNRLVLANALFDQNTRQVTLILEEQYAQESNGTSLTPSFRPGENGVLTYTSSGTTGSSPPILHSNNIVVTKVNGNGSVIFQTWIPKSFKFSSVTNYNSFFACEYDQQLFFFFNNTNPADVGKNPHINLNMFTDLVALDPSGNIKTNQTIFNSDATHILFEPHACRYLGQGKVLLYGHKGKTFRFGTAILK